MLVMVGSLLITLPISTQLHSVISRPIREISKAARQIASGDLTVEITSSLRADEIGTLVAAFGQMLANLREVMRQIAGSAKVLTSSSGEIVTTAAHVAGTKQAEQAAHTLNELGRKLKEMVGSYKV